MCKMSNTEKLTELIYQSSPRLVEEEAVILAGRLVANGVTIRPKGMWVKHQRKRLFEKEYYTCSNCKSRNGLAIKFNYCFNCGAKMEE